MRVTIGPGARRHRPNGRRRRFHLRHATRVLDGRAQLAKDLRRVDRRVAVDRREVRRPHQDDLGVGTHLACQHDGDAADRVVEHDGVGSMHGERLNELDRGGRFREDQEPLALPGRSATVPSALGSLRRRRHRCADVRGSRLAPHREPTPVRPGRRSRRCRRAHVDGHTGRWVIRNRPSPPMRTMPSLWAVTVPCRRKRMLPSLHGDPDRAVPAHANLRRRHVVDHAVAR